MGFKNYVLNEMLKSHTAKEIVDALEECSKYLAFEVREELNDRENLRLRNEGIDYESDWHHQHPLGVEGIDYD